MSLKRILFSLLAVILSSSPTWAQSPDDDVTFEKIDTKRLRKLGFLSGFQPYLEDTTIDQLELLDGHLEKQEWSKAFRVMEEQRESAGSQMLPTSDGCWLPVEQYHWHRLNQLPPPGRDAFRLYYNAKAQKLLSDINTIADESALRNLKRLYASYFLTTTGEQAANLLGDAYFQRGQFSAAERCWHSILEHHPEGEIPEHRLQVKRAFAMARDGDEPRLREICDDITARFKAEKITLGGQDRLAGDVAKELLATTSQSPAEWNATTYPKAYPTSTQKPDWKFPLGKGSAHMTLFSLDDESLCLQIGDKVHCVDRKTGKPGWFPDKPKDAGAPKKLTWGDLTKMVGQLIASSEVDIVGDPDFAPILMNNRIVCSLPTGETNDEGYPINVISVLDRSDGKKLWDSAKALTDYHAIGSPCVWSQHLIVLSFKQPSNKLFLHALDIDDGAVQWTLRLGSVRATTEGDEMGYGPSFSNPSLVSNGDTVYVLPSDGAFISVDMVERKLSSLYKFRPPARADMSQWGWGEPSFVYHDTTARIVSARSQLFCKDGGGGTLLSFDPHLNRILWQRPINEKAQLLNCDEKLVYLLSSNELVAIHRTNRKLAWAINLPGPITRSLAILDNSVLVPTIRGVFELSKENGDPIVIHRTGEDMGTISRVIANDGDLFIVKKTTIEAYLQRQE